MGVVPLTHPVDVDESEPIRVSLSPLWTSAGTFTKSRNGS